MQMANMLEGGRTPLLPAEQLQEMGFKIVAYPLSLLGAYVQGLQQTLQLLHRGGPESFPPSTLPSFEALQAAVGFPQYLQGAEKYAKLEQGLATAFSSPATASQSASSSGDSVSTAAESPAGSAQMGSASSSSNGSLNGSADPAPEQRRVVEADAILVDSGQSREGPADNGQQPDSTPPARTEDARWQDPSLRR